MSLRDYLRIYSSKCLLIKINFTNIKFHDIISNFIFSHANVRYKNIWSKTTLKTENKLLVIGERKIFQSFMKFNLYGL